MIFSGCKVIGFADSKEEVEWLTNELKFDNVYCYWETVYEALEAAAPDGIDCYFDNVSISIKRLFS